AGHAAGNLVDVGEVEINLALLRGGQDVQHRVGGAAHGHVQGHRVDEGVAVGDVARQHRLIALVVVLPGQVDDGLAGLGEQVAARLLRRQRGTVARQRQAQGLGQAVHRVGGEHAGAGTAGWARRTLDVQQLLVVDLVVGRRGDGGDEVRTGLDHAVDDDGETGLHRAARHEHDRDVQAQRRVEHARGDLVAVGDAHQGVGRVRVDHVLDRVGDDLAGRQRVEHAVVAHGDAVVHGDGVELAGDATGGGDRLRDNVADVLEVHVARHELGVRIRDGDDRLPEVLVGHAGGAPQRAGARGIAAGGGDL